MGLRDRRGQDAGRAVLLRREPKDSGSTTGLLGAASSSVRCRHGPACRAHRRRDRRGVPALPVVRRRGARQHQGCALMLRFLARLSHAVFS